jgi:hypothetical protein
VSYQLAELYYERKASAETTETGGLALPAVLDHVVQG